VKSLAVVIALAALAHAAPPPRPATFALVIGVNHSVDPDTETLRYADDDAAQYFEMFRSLGARTYLLTDLDPGDRALYPQAAAEALPPTRRALDDAVTRLAADLDRARKAGVATALYVVYAGHGNVGDDGGYISLADARLTGAAIARDIIARANADRTHLIVDACDSYLLTLGRGPGGRRRVLHGFAALRSNFDDTKVGLLLSTSSARASHEWQGFSSGVFSYEVRAGLQGAADVDGDGFVSYREIAAFVARANAAIENPAYRPDIFARPPAGSPILLDIRTPDRFAIDAPGHYILEDSRGVRLAELHPAQPVQLVRRKDAGTLYLRDVDANTELAIAPDGSTETSAVRVSSRGAADALFGKLFRLPFDQRAVDDYAFPAPIELDVISPRDDRVRRLFGRLAFGGAGVLALGAGVAAWSSHAIRSDITAMTPQAVVVEQNARIRTRDHLALGLGLGAFAAAGAGALLVWWPDRDRDVIVVPIAGGIAAAGRF
jgi:hypothetical protein